jgi:excisionase family DNA binding protein
MNHAPSPRAPATPAPLLTVHEVAQTLRVSKTSVYRLVERRLVPFYRLPGSLRFTEDDVQAFLRRSRVESMERKPL